LPSAGLRIGSRSRGDLLLDGVERIAHPVHVLDEKVVASNPAFCKLEMSKRGKSWARAATVLYRA
jgi:hypothetical protein